MAMFQNLSSLLNKNQGPNVAQNAAYQTQQANVQQKQGIQQQQNQIGQAQVYNQGALNQNIQNMNQGAIQNQLGTTYQGPKAGTINAMPANANNIAQQGQALGSTGGQMALLQKQYGRPDYSLGQQRMDAALQARNSGFQQKRAEAQNAARKLIGAGNTANSALNNQAQTTEMGTEAYVDRTKQGLGDFNKNVTTKAEQDAAQANKSDLETYQQYQDMRNKIAGGKMSKDMIEKLGLGAGSRTYGANLADALKYEGNKGQATANQLVSKDDYNRFKMVQELLGDKSQVLDPSQAGTYKKGEYNPDKEKAAELISQSKGNYDAALAPALNDYRGAQQLVNELSAAGNMTDPNQQNATWQSIVQRYGLNPSGGIGRNLEWAIKDNLARHKARFDQVQKQLDSAYAGNIEEES